MKYAIKNPYNAQDFPKFQEVNHKPSMTVPDQTMSLKQLLDRYRRGLPVIGNDSEPIYYGEEGMDLPDLKKMDLSEIAELKAQVQENIREQQTILQNEQYAKDRAEAEKQQRELFKKWQDEQNQTDNQSEPAPRAKGAKS